MIKDLIQITLLTWLIELTAAAIKGIFKALKFIVTSPIKFLIKQLQKPEDIEGKVKGVIDGDSLVVETAEGTKEVRIKGIDAPEYGQAGFAPAKRAVQRMALGHNVILKDQETDTYGRVLAHVEFKDKEGNAAETLVEQGLAYPDPEDTTRKIKAKAKEAKKAKKGVWDGKELAPWKFRERGLGVHDSMGGM
jgi:micrococcal nuclease